MPIVTIGSPLWDEISLMFDITLKSPLCGKQNLVPDVTTDWFAISDHQNQFEIFQAG